MELLIIQIQSLLKMKQKIKKKNINIKIKPVSLNKSKENIDSLDGFDELKRRLAEELSIDEKLINIILKKTRGGMK